MKPNKKLIERIEKSFNMIVNEYGESKWQSDIPYLEILPSTAIAKFPGVFADGKFRKGDLELIEGWFDHEDNSIVLILENIEKFSCIIKTILHEYQHYLQCPSWLQRYYDMGYTYENHPYEVQATNAEDDWYKFIIK